MTNIIGLAFVAFVWAMPIVVLWWPVIERIVK